MLLTRRHINTFTSEIFFKFLNKFRNLKGTSRGAEENLRVQVLITRRDSYCFILGVLFIKITNFNLSIYKKKTNWWLLFIASPRVERGGTFSAISINNYNKDIFIFYLRPRPPRPRLLPRGPPLPPPRPLIDIKLLTTLNFVGVIIIPTSSTITIWSKTSSWSGFWSVVN